MTCRGCGNEKAYKTVSGQGWEHCDECGAAPKVGIADVFWDGKPEHGLADDPKTGRPLVFGSKAEKANYLRARGLSEAGDKFHGAPVMVSHEKPSEGSREEAARAIQRVRQMGGDVRRQELNRILKEGSRR